jgi:hypothetical protein
MTPEIEAASKLFSSLKFSNIGELLLSLFGFATVLTFYIIIQRVIMKISVKKQVTESLKPLPAEEQKTQFINPFFIKGKKHVYYADHIKHAFREVYNELMKIYVELCKKEIQDAKLAGNIITKDENFELERLLFNNTLRIVVEIELTRDMYEYIDLYFNSVNDEMSMQKIIDHIAVEMQSQIIAQIRLLYVDINEVTPLKTALIDQISERYLRTELFTSMVRKLLYDINKITENFNDPDYLTKNFIVAENYFVQQYQNKK